MGIFAVAAAPVAHVEDDGVAEHVVERLLERYPQGGLPDDHPEFALPINPVASRRDPVGLSRPDDAGAGRLGEEVGRVPVGVDLLLHVHLGGVGAVVGRRRQQVRGVEERCGQAVGLDAEPEAVLAAREMVRELVQPAVGPVAGGDDRDQVRGKTVGLGADFSGEEGVGRGQVQDRLSDDDGRAG